MPASRQTLLIPVLAALTGFAPMATDMYLPGLPAIAAEYGGAGARVELTLSAFFTGFAVGQLLLGPLSDRFGRKRPLVLGLTLFTAGSIACANASSIGALVLFRFLEGLGGCAGPVIARAMVRDLWERERAARVLSLMVLIMSLAPLVAPLLGGQVLVFAGWRVIFWCLALFGLSCILAALAVLSETLPFQRRQRGRLTSLVSAYWAPLTSRRYLAYAVSGSIIYCGFFAYLAGSPAVLITYFGVRPDHYGLFFGANVVGIMTMSAINGRLVGRIGVDRALTIGIGVAATAGPVLALVALSGAPPLAFFLPPLFCFVASIGMVGANTMAGCLGLFPDRAGVASALAGTLQFTIGALGATLVSLLGDGTPLPMAGVIAGSGLLSLAVRHVLAR
jgi:MFS transporter, DHA1 family, multidrug resistance protein